MGNLRCLARLVALYLFLRGDDLTFLFNCGFVLGDFSFGTFQVALGQRIVLPVAGLHAVLRYAVFLYRVFTHHLICAVFQVQADIGGGR